MWLCIGTQYPWMNQDAPSITDHFEPAVLAKVSAAAQAYKELMKCRNGKSMDFNLWFCFAQMLVIFEDAIVEAGIEGKQERDQILRTFTGTARSTARRHRQIFETLDRIPNPQEYRSWKSLLKAAQQVGQ